MSKLPPGRVEPLRFASLVGVSGLVHALVVGAWAAAYRPVDPDQRRSSASVSAVRMVRQGPPATPEPRPKPRREPDPQPPSREQDEPRDVTDTSRPPGPPPPLPKACRGCPKVPASTKPRTHRAPTATAVPVGVPGGVPGGVVGGVPGGVLGGVPGGVLGGTLSRNGPGVPSRRAPMEPLKVVLAQAIYTPDPDTKKLQRTATGLLRRGAGVNKTGFCIDVRGRTVDVTTNRKYPGDPQIDALCRQTVASWRFRPFLVDGEPAKVCSVARFEIRFE